MVNKTFLPPAAHPTKYLTLSSIGIFRVGTAFAEYIANRRAWESARVHGIRTAAWESRLQGSIKRGDHRWRIRFSSDYRGR